MHGAGSKSDETSMHGSKAGSKFLLDPRKGSKPAFFGIREFRYLANQMPFYIPI